MKTPADFVLVFLHIPNLNLRMVLSFNNLELLHKKIIIVEDDLPSIKYYETLLRNSGAEIVIFRNGKDFVEYISENNNELSIVFMDFLVPFVNGIDCIRILRKTRKSTPVIMLTAYFSEQCKADAMVAGCNEFVLKPVFPERFVYLLEKYLILETSDTSVSH
jgi:two-component system, OmpR family, response regulator ArlR